MVIPGIDFDILIFLVVIASFLFGAWFGRFMTRYPFGQKPQTGMEFLIGEMAIVRKVRNRILEVSADGQIWVAENTGTSEIKEGDYVKIEAVEGMKLKVSGKH